MSQNSTITSGLGLKEDYFDFLLETVERRWKKSETISDLMISAASDIKYEEFEVSDNHLSEYEKKLVLLGMVIGLEKLAQDIKTKHLEMFNDLFKDIFSVSEEEEDQENDDDE